MFFFFFLFYLEEKEERELQLEERDPDLEEDEEAEDPLPSCHENLLNSILYIYKNIYPMRTFLFHL